MKISIIGGGNLGVALAKGMVSSGKYKAKDITITRRNLSKIKVLEEDGLHITSDNRKAIENAEIVIIAVLPQQFNSVMEEIGSDFTSGQLLVSLVSGVSISNIREFVSTEVEVARAMPNTAISIGESMTCIAVDDNAKSKLDQITDLFDTVGTTMTIREEMMTSATALCACGIAFFLRAVRAASQGGIEIGFHSEEALKMAAQTAKGAASLLLELGKHPEGEIDKVTSPEGCTIAGLNEMEHQGFSSALIKGITTSAKKASGLYKK